MTKQEKTALLASTDIAECIQQMLPGTPVPLDLSLKILRPGTLDPHDRVDHDLTFDLWHEVWQETRREISPELPAYADNFTRQDEILVLRHSGLPIGTCCYRYVDLQRRCTLLDSYFDPALWPESVRKMLPELGNVCALGSHIFVHPNFRGRKADASIRKVMCTLAIMRVQYTGLDLMLGMVRTDRGMDRVFQDNGAITLARTNWHNLPINLIAILPTRRPVVMDPRTAAAVHMAIDSSIDELRTYGDLWRDARYSDERRELT